MRKQGTFWWLCAALLFVLGQHLNAHAISPDEIRVKKAIADTMTPEELAAYKARMAEHFSRRSSQPSLILPMQDDTCPAATHEISALPFGPIADTTVGATDNYNLPADTTSPTCTAPSSCTGAGPAGSLPRGAIYTGTGTAPDRAWRIRTDANCNVTITMDPTGAQDLALIVYEANCSSSLADCACVDDTGVGGVAEQVTLSAVAGTDYFILVDGYSTGGTPPGPSGPYTLQVTGSGCNLVPVELQGFSVE